MSTPEVLNNIARNLRRYTLESKLEVIRKIAVCIDPLHQKTDISKYIFVDSYLPKQWYPHGAAQLFELEYLALVSTVVGEWEGPLQELNKLNEFRKIANLYRSYNPQFINITDSTMLGDREAILNLFFLRLTHQQFKYQYHPLAGLYRHNYFFSYSNPNFDLKKVFLEIFEYPYEDYLVLAYSYQMICSLSYETMDIDRVVNDLCKGRLFTQEKLSSMLKRLSMDRSTAIEIYSKYKNPDDRLRIYDYNPYTLRPILTYQKKLFAPIPRLLVNAITEGFLSYIFTLKGIGFRNSFGQYTFYDYLHEVLKDDKAIDTIIPEFTFYINRQEYKSPDFILVQDNNIIILEAKATTPTVALKTASMGDYLDQLKKAYGKAILQCIKKERLIIGKMMIHDKLPKHIGKIYFLIVTLEDFRFPVDNFLKSKIIDLCKSEGALLKENRDFHAMSIQTLEDIIEKDNRDLFAFLEERETTQTVFKTYTESFIRLDKEIKEQKDFIFWDSNIRKLSLDLFGKSI